MGGGLGGLVANGLRIAESSAAGRTLGWLQEDTPASNVRSRRRHCMCVCGAHGAQQTEMTNGVQRSLPRRTPLSLQCIARQPPSRLRTSGLPH